MIQKIFILWASGNVGRELIKQIVKKDSIGNHRNPSEIVWIANRSHYIFKHKGIKKKVLKKISSSRGKAIELLKLEWKKIPLLIDILQIIEDAWMDWEIVFADATAGKENLLDFHKKVLLDSQNFLVTANKNPISLFSMEDFRELNKYSGRYNTNTTVMWGGGVSNFVIERADKIHDTIVQIDGMFSGTLWYILSELEKQEQNFSEIVKEAQQKWYTEPNPWDDLNGLDVARKLIILSRYAGNSVELSDIDIIPLIDEKYAQYQWEEFLEKIKDEDSNFNLKVEDAKEQGKVLRYVAQMKNNDGKLSLKVWLEAVERNSDLGTLSGTSNIAIVETDILQNPLPHVIKSRWAGLEVTAGAIRVGIAKMLPQSLKTQ